MTLTAKTIFAITSAIALGDALPDAGHGKMAIGLLAAYHYSVRTDAVRAWKLVCRTSAALWAGRGMGLSVTFVSGLRGAGKSTLIQGMVDRLCKFPPHYIRLVQAGSNKPRPKPCAKVASDCGVASARWLEYDEEQIFEALPEALAAIHRADRFGVVILEADADPGLRHAYPYDHRVFVMPMPERLSRVFREPRRAAMELERVLDDTAAFASEIYGLFADDGADDADPHEARPSLSDTQMRGFLYSPLGDELATRIQLQPEYHGLVESDVVVVNTHVGSQGPDTSECLRRIERLLIRVPGVSSRRNRLFLCDLNNPQERVGRKLFDALRPVCARGT